MINLKIKDTANILEIGRIISSQEYIRSKITKSNIYIYNDTLNNEVLKLLLSNIEILEIMNFEDKSIEEKKEIRYNRVKRGQVYYCDFGEPYESEQAGIRYAIIVQNDTGNKFSPNTIVISCTTSSRENLPTHLSFTFSKDNMKGYSQEKVREKNNILQAETIRDISKSRLLEYLGTMSDDFMKEVDKYIEISLELKRKEIEKEASIIHVDAPIDKYILEGIRSLTLNQVIILNTINTNNLFEILRIGNITSMEKIKRSLILFGFDETTDEFNHLSLIILICTKLKDVNKETICNQLSSKYSIKDTENVVEMVHIEIRRVLQLTKIHSIEFINLLKIIIPKGD